MIGSYIFGTLWVLFVVGLISIFRVCRKDDDWWPEFWVYFIIVGAILGATSAFVNIKSTTFEITDKVVREYHTIGNNTYQLVDNKWNNTTSANFIGNKLKNEDLEKIKKQKVFVKKSDSFWIKDVEVKVYFQ